MAIEVAKVELKTVQDASGLEGLIAAGICPATGWGRGDGHEPDCVTSTVPTGEWTLGRSESD